MTLSWLYGRKTHIHILTYQNISQNYVVFPCRKKSWEPLRLFLTFQDVSETNEKMAKREKKKGEWACLLLLLNLQRIVGKVTRSRLRRKRSVYIAGVIVSNLWKLAVDLSESLGDLLIMVQWKYNKLNPWF